MRSRRQVATNSQAIVSWPQHMAANRFTAWLSTADRRIKPHLSSLNPPAWRVNLSESLGEDPAEFRKYFDFDDPDLAASLNHNYSLDVFAEDERANVQSWYDKFDSKNVGAHIDGPPFVALLINDRPGLQVVAGEGQWMNAPVTCRTAPGDYVVPVIPGSVIVNTGGTLMHLSEGRYSATLHRVNTTLIPRGDTRISMPYFLIPKMEGDLIPFGKTAAALEGTAGYNAGRDRGANACVNRMGTFPQVTRRWWVEEFKELSEKQRVEVEAETAAAYKVAAERGQRYREHQGLALRCEVERCSPNNTCNTLISRRPKSWISHRCLPIPRSLDR